MKPLSSLQYSRSWLPGNNVAHFIGLVYDGAMTELYPQQANGPACGGKKYLTSKALSRVYTSAKTQQPCLIPSSLSTVKYIIFDSAKSGFGSAQF